MEMSSTKTLNYLNLFIILTALLLLIPLSSNEKINEIMEINNINGFDIFEGPYNSDDNGYDPRSDIPPSDDLMEEIQATREKKDSLEIECQQKKIYVIALGVLSGIFMLLIIIYSIFKCYMFLLARKDQSTPFRRIRISKLGQVYLEENFDLNKSEINENNDNPKNMSVNDNDKNDAPTCFSANKNQNTFNPDNCDENNNYYKPYKIDDN
jgi:hypothetical protein